MANPSVNPQALKSEIRQALINSKVFACPIAMRVAWHASGTFDKNDNTGGSNGATMRFEPEKSDPANAGLNIVRDMLHEVNKRHPEVSQADLWTYAGCVAVEFMGGPKIPFKFGRKDDADGSRCPMNGRLPDAAQGAQHLRDVFYRMGFNDRDIVCLSGGHTVGRCHIARSGFDGPWTRNPISFDNAYFRHLLDMKWVKRNWDGPLQYEDEETGKLMMLPTDLALVEDAKFKEYVELYAKDQDLFFRDFAVTFGKLLALGCPAVDPSAPDAPPTEQEKLNAEFREHAMHGSVGALQKLADKVDVHEVEKSSNRSALHKAAFWGHVDATRLLVNDLKLKVDLQDSKGDTPLHDAARFGHLDVCKILLDANATANIKNNDNQDPLSIAIEHGYSQCAELIRTKGKL